MKNREELETIVNDFDYIICGSDQIWAPNVFDSIYMLDFRVKRNVKKIAYAPSIGMNELPENCVLQYKKCLDSFDAISIRESKGKEILSKQCGKHSTVVLDPTLLLDKEDYIQLEKPIRGIKHPFVFCYFLNDNNEYQQSVLKALKEKNISIVGVSKKETDSQWMKCYNYIGPCEFLWFIHHASYVFTDSYHATIFSMLYNKVFCTFRRFNNQDIINQNSRLNQLESWFHISKQIINATDVPSLDEHFNYHDFESNLNKAKRISISYLMEALR